MYQTVARFLVRAYVTRIRALIQFEVAESNQVCFKERSGARCAAKMVTQCSPLPNRRSEKCLPTTGFAPQWFVTLRTPHSTPHRLSGSPGLRQARIWA